MSVYRVAFGRQERKINRLEICLRHEFGKKPVHICWSGYDGPYLGNYRMEPSKTIHLHLQLSGHQSHPFRSYAFVRRKLVRKQAYRRFCNRRNVNPTAIHSVNGSNFVAADKELSEKVTWKFNPSRVFHQGRFYEIFFKLFRNIYRNIVSSCTLGKLDPFIYTAEIERILNNRPIIRLPDSPVDCSALTPNSILTGSIDEDQPLGSFTKGQIYFVGLGRRPNI